MIIRQAREKDVMQIAEIMVEDWQTAYRGIMDDEYLDSLSAEQRYQIEIELWEVVIEDADKKLTVDYCCFSPFDFCFRAGRV